MINELSPSPGIPNPVRGYDRDPMVKVAVSSACCVGLKPSVNDAEAPGLSDDGKLVSDPSVNGDCEKTAATTAGLSSGRLAVVLFSTVIVAVFVPPTGTCPNAMVLPDEITLVFPFNVRLTLSVGATPVPLMAANVSTDTFCGGVPGHPAEAAYEA